MTLRVVSLVPSLTEAFEATVPGVVVGATDWCTHPPGLAAERIGGTKNPRVDDVVALAPDVVIANDEENRAPDIAALREAGCEVIVTDYVTVDGALEGMGDLMHRLGLGQPRWLDEARSAWAEPWTGQRQRAVVPIWRRPWMAVGRDTFTGDVLRRLGVDNVLADHDERYPKVDLEALPPHDLVVLPDEPYAFSPDDGPECFAARSACVSGRHLTWYGPSLAEAPTVLLPALWPGRP